MPCANHPEVLDGLNTCDRCGVWFCGDCLVELRGSCVCATCKGEQVRDIQSGVAPGELQLASLWARFAALLVDWIVLMVLTAPLIVLVVLEMLREGANANPMANLGLQLGVQLAALAIVILYEGIMLQWRGQTVGKIALGIKVVTAEGNDISAGQAWVRPIIRFLLSTFCSCVGVLVDYIPAFFKKDKTTVHDMAAKTRVVKLG